MKYESEPDHREQQTRTTEAEEWQRNTSQWEYARHRADVHDSVGHDKPEHTSDSQTHHWIVEPVDREQ